MELKEQKLTKPAWKEIEAYSHVTKTLWHQFDRLEVKNGVFMRKWTPLRTTEMTWQIVLPRTLRREFIRISHSGLNGGHLGKSKTEHQVSRRAYWPGWQEEVSLELKKCQPCSQYHRGKAPRLGALHPFFSGESFETISIDITGKHPKSKRGNEYIITIIDIFSKWAEAIPVRNHTAEVVAKALMEKIICKFGAPLRILSDQGREFESALFKELCERMEIQKIRSSPYQPTTNGCVERFHRTLNSMLAKVISENQRDWDDYLEPVMMAYRASKHSATGYTPNYLILGKEVRAPVDIVLGPIFEEDQEESPSKDYDEFVEKQLTIYQDAFQLAREQLDTSATKRKTDYDHKVKNAKFSTGEYVWYYYPRRYSQRSPKWTKNYDGPFLVVQEIPPTDYKIQKSRRSTPIVVHVNKLKPCNSEGLPPPWVPPTMTETSPTSKNDGTEKPEEEETTPSTKSQEATAQEAKAKKRQRRTSPQDLEIFRMEDAIDEVIRSRGGRRAPKYLDDYLC